MLRRGRVSRCRRCPTRCQVVVDETLSAHGISRSHQRTPAVPGKFLLLTKPRALRQIGNREDLQQTCFSNLEASVASRVRFHVMSRRITSRLEASCHARSIPTQEQLAALSQLREALQAKCERLWSRSRDAGRTR
jgi:hypothetical protein